MSDLPPNWKYLGGSFYVVRTQAGFEQALKHFNDGDKIDTKDLRGFPKSYPSFVSFSYGYEGYSYIRANCMNVNKLRDALKDV